MTAETYAQRALQRSHEAERCGALVPLETELLELDHAPFVLRRLLSRTPKHLRAGGPKPNPFLPWDPALEVCRVSPEHVLLLNKYPVQRGHVLLITDRWKPQAGWLERSDWEAAVHVAQDTRGLWFFNSCPSAGASQPHRHLQLLPRDPDTAICPLAPRLESALGCSPSAADFPWAYALSRRQSPGDAAELARLYADHCHQLGLGSAHSDPCPRKPYNLLFSDRWFLTLLRSQEHWAGFSVNALGFAGYLLATEDSDLDWLRQQGPWALLKAVSVTS